MRKACRGPLITAAAADADKLVSTAWSNSGADVTCLYPSPGVCESAVDIVEGICMGRRDGIESHYNNFQWLFTFQTMGKELLCNVICKVSMKSVHHRKKA